MSITEGGGAKESEPGLPSTLSRLTAPPYPPCGMIQPRREVGSGTPPLSLLQKGGQLAGERGVSSGGCAPPSLPKPAPSNTTTRLPRTCKRSPPCTTCPGPCRGWWPPQKRRAHAAVTAAYAATPPAAPAPGGAPPPLRRRAVRGGADGKRRGKEARRGRGRWGCRGGARHITAGRRHRERRRLHRRDCARGVFRNGRPVVGRPLRRPPGEPPRGGGAAAHPAVPPPPPPTCPSGRVTFTPSSAGRGVALEAAAAAAAAEAV